MADKLEVILSNLTGFHGDRINKRGRVGVGEGELEICWTNGNLMPQELADIITGPLNPSSEDEEDATVDYEDISDVVFENDF